MPEPPPRLQQFEALQVLRAIAAVAVVLYHAAGSTAKYSHSVATSNALLQFGNAGVDLFFVISGFVMYYTTRQGTSTAGFARKRLARIVPLYWILTLAFLGASAALGLGEAFDPRRLGISLAFLSFTDGRMPLLYVGWTLEYEMYFYLVVALCLLTRPRPWSIVVLALCIAVFAGQVLPHRSPVIAFLSSPMLLEFVLGVLLAQVATNRRTRIADLVAFALATVAVVVHGGADARVLVSGAIAGVIVHCCLALERRGMRVPRIGVQLGDASYSIYLVQVFTIPATGKAVQRALPSLAPDALVIVGTLSTVVAGVILWRWVEVPVRSWLRGDMRPRDLLATAGLKSTTPRLP